MKRSTIIEERRAGKESSYQLIKRFWKWVKPHRRYVFAAFGLLLLSTPLSLLSPLIVRRVIDDAVEHTKPDDVFFWGGVLVAMTCVSVLFGLSVGYATTLFHLKVLRDLRLALYSHMQRLSMRYYGDKETGTLMSRQVDDINNLGGVMADSFARAGVDAIQGLGYVVMIFLLEWRMATAGLLLVGLIFGFQYAISGHLRELSKRVRETWTAVSETLHQGLTGQALVRATASEKREKRRFAGVLHESVRAQVRRDLFSLISNQAFGLVGGVGPTVIVIAGVYLIVAGDFTVGGLFAFFMYLVQMFGCVGRITGLNPRLQGSLASLERIYEILEAEPEIESAPQGIRIPRIRGAVRFEQVSFSYESDRPVLEEISLDVEAEKMVALVGPSGAGKTTLAHLVPRFYDPDSGRIFVDDHDLRSLDLRNYRRQVGLVPQEIFLFDRTVAENIAYGSPKVSERDIRAAAEAANALEFIEAMPDGFESLIGERGVRLSGGQRQRLAIAREILRDPSILILDEATSSLDSATEQLIQEALGELLAGRTAFVIAHRLSTVLRADLIVVLDRGRIVETGSHTALLSSGGLYSRLFRTQFEDPVQEARS